MGPTRLSFITYNLWNTQRWPEREPALRGFFRRFRPDIFCLQELREVTRDVLDDTLPGFRRVDDAFPGWLRESNIYWNNDLLEEVQHGGEDIGIDSDAYRRLFWARLRVRATGRTLFVATAHFTYQEHPDEIRTGQSPRGEQARRAGQALKSLVRDDEPGFFLGDLNDPVLPAHILIEYGYRSCFERLELLPPSTWPAQPTARIVPWEVISSQTIDWILSNDNARPVAACVPQYYLEDLSPSDHWPVQAVYEVG
jgi:endonuclease/exonuclease/phosphatase family metal-dependent hydrolase